MHPKSLIKKVLLTILFSAVQQTCLADTLTVSSAEQMPRVRLDKYMTIWEDPSCTSDTAFVLHAGVQFQPLASFRKRSPLSFYWLQATIRNDQKETEPLVLSFSSLTYVDIYVYEGGQCILYKKAGAFRERKFLAPGDGRTYAQLTFQPGKTYRLLLKVHHTKHFWPVFDFSLQQKDEFIQHLYRKKITDGWSQGALLLFLIYTFLLWMASKFRPYIWLMCFIAGIGLYGIASGGYLIEWFFPNSPATGWMFNLNFTHLGCFGMYMLLIDFWKIKQHNPALYKYGKGIIVGLITMSATGFCIDYFTGNFDLVNTINLWSFIFPVSFIIASFWLCWRRLNAAQRYLAYGIILFFVAGLFITFSSAILKEKSLSFSPYITNITALAIYLLFATGLKRDLHQHEIEKALLADRNTKIETLINELNHRVKNNLQLLYSLNSLQAPTITDPASREIIKGNMGKIKAMMLVNDKLFQFEEQSSMMVGAFTKELCDHLQNIYDSKRNVTMQQHVAASIRLQGKQALSFGLILSELLTNSFKYAFAGIDNPFISIEVFPVNEEAIQFVYADNGIGIPPAATTGKTSTMGITLIYDLTRQMNGTVEVESGSGLTYQFIIPV